MDKITCEWCKKKIGQKINNDWKDRQMHKKCYFEKQDHLISYARYLNVK